MQKVISMFIYLFFCLVCFNTSAQMYGKWGDQGNGTYVNPVIPADFSDLDVIRVGDNYYAISSTMQYSPGMAVLHSKDLVNWEIIAHVVNDLRQISPKMNWDQMNAYERGIWAGSIRYYKNKFWVYFGTPDDGFFMSSAEHAEGPWAPLHQVWNVKGWDDCCSFYDDDGQVYFMATNFELDPKNNKQYNIHLFKMTPEGKSLIMESDTIIHQSKGSEANKLYKINGYYYHFFSNVNAEGGRQIMMGRSKNLYGKWEIKQLNRVNRKKDREPNQGGLITVDKNEWYFFTHHGRGDWEGRPASLLPVNWLDNWPIIGEVGPDSIGEMVWSGTKPIILNELLSLKTSDDFENEKLGHQWEWNYQPRADKWSLTERKGFLRLHAFQPIDPENQQKILMRAGNTITQRSMRTHDNVVTIKLDFGNMENGQYAGLTHFSTQNMSTIGIKQSNGKRILTYVFNDEESEGVKLKKNVIWLQSKWDVNGKNQYFYSLNGKKYIPFGNVTQLTWGSYRGDRIGIFNYNILQDKGYVDIDWFKYEISKDKSTP
ncbi:MAG: glycoside hydrolase 43 family protein [Spirosomataceae bacterium]